MAEPTRTQLLEMVSEYESTLRFIFESWRDRYALALHDPTPENHREVAAFRDMSRYALESLRRFHPDETFPDITPQATRKPRQKSGGKDARTGV